MPTTKTANDELATESGRQLLKLLATTALLGGGIRTGMGALRNANPRYEIPAVPKPVVVDMPYPAPPSALPVGPIPLPGAEKKLKAASDLPGWAQNPFGAAVHEQLPTYVPATGQPGETDPTKVPLFGAAQLAALVGGGAAGFYGADKVLRSADRWGAQRELADAKREYQKSVLARLSGSSVPTKRAAEVQPPAELQALTTALAELYSNVKKAEDDPATWTKLLTSAGFPGLSGIAGPTGARANMALAALAGAGGGYLGYNAVRDSEAKQKARNAIRDVDRANAALVPPPTIARLVPVPTGAVR